GSGSATGASFDWLVRQRPVIGRPPESGRGIPEGGPGRTVVEIAQQEGNEPTRRLEVVAVPPEDSRAGDAALVVESDGLVDEVSRRQVELLIDGLRAVGADGRARLGAAVEREVNARIDRVERQ